MLYRFLETIICLNISVEIEDRPFFYYIDDFEYFTIKTGS